MEQEHEGVLRTFLIADVRGYTRFTQTRGDEAAAELAARFARLTREAVTAGGGELVELRGDEALAVFASPRQAVRTAVEIQRRLRGALDPDEALPLGIGIGIDTGEAVPVEGGWRGKALNVAARLCSLAQPGEIQITETVGALAGGIPGVRLVPRKPVRVKGIDQPVRLLDVVPETPLPPLRPLDNAGASRRRVLVPAAAGALVVVAGGVAMLGFGGSSSAGSLATNSLGVVDGAGHVHDVVAVGKGPTEIVADDSGALWIADKPGHALLRVDPNTHAVSSRSRSGTRSRPRWRSATARSGCSTAPAGACSAGRRIPGGRSAATRSATAQPMSLMEPAPLGFRTRSTGLSPALGRPTERRPRSASGSSRSRPHSAPARSGSRMPAATTSRAWTWRAVSSRSRFRSVTTRER
jgi:class 3 adenylate cyclase